MMAKPEAEFEGEVGKTAASAFFALVGSLRERLTR
jgi:hypothetical protein